MRSTQDVAVQQEVRNAAKGLVQAVALSRDGKLCRSPFSLIACFQDLHCHRHPRSSAWVYDELPQ